MADTVVLPVRDRSDENSSVTVYAKAAISDAEITAIFNAIVGVTIGNVEKSVLKISTDKDAGVVGVPGNAFAQREIKWLVRYTDSVTGKKYRFEIPTADLDLTTAGTDFMDLSSTEGAALVSALEAGIVSQDGNAVNIDTVEFVGRNT